MGKNVVDKAFDLKTEANTVFATYPHLRGNTFFAAVVADDDVQLTCDPDKTPQRAIETAVGLLQTLGTQPDTVKDHYINAYDINLVSVDLRAPRIDALHRWMPAQDRARFRTHLLHYIFDHETGHMVAPHGNNDPRISNINEHAADAYAAMRHIQRFGKHAVPFLNMMSALRAANAIHNGAVPHLTAVTIDRVIRHSRQLDYFKSVSPASLLHRAGFYAEQNHLDTLQQNHFLDSVKGPTGHMPDGRQRALRLYDTAMTAGHAYVFYIAARAFSPFLRPQGHYSHAADATVSFDSAEARAMRQALTGRAKAFNIKSIRHIVNATRLSPRTAQQRSTPA